MSLPQASLSDILFINRSYWPDAEATGQLLTELCESMPTTANIHVIAGQPNKNPTNESFQTSGSMLRNGVEIHRVRHTQFSKRWLPLRALNMITFFLSATIRGLLLRNIKVVVVQTDPPLLPLTGLILSYWHRARLVVYLQDIYPDVATKLGKLKEGMLTGTVRWLLKSVYQRSNQIIVLSRDMKQNLVSWGVNAELIRIIPNWVDTNLVKPIGKQDNDFRQAQRLQDQFVVMYSGNLGLTQNLNAVLEAAHHLRSKSNISFILIGDGATRQALEKKARALELSNLRFLDYQPKSMLAHSLSAADLHLVPLDPALIGCLMPSKLYGILAAGVPVLAMTDAACELATTVSDNACGFVVPFNNPTAIAEQVLWAAQHWDELAQMQVNCRSLAVEEYHSENIIRELADTITFTADLNVYPKPSAKKRNSELLRNEHSASDHADQSRPRQFQSIGAAVE